MYTSASARALHRFLSHKWYFDTVYNRFVNKPLLQGAYRVVFALIDKGLLEFFGPTGLSEKAVSLGRRFTSYQTGRVYDYGWAMILFIYVYAALNNFGPSLGFASALTALAVVEKNQATTQSFLVRIKAFVARLSLSERLIFFLILPLLLSLLPATGYLLYQGHITE